MPQINRDYNTRCHCLQVESRIIPPESLRSIKLIPEGPNCPETEVMWVEAHAVMQRGLISMLQFDIKLPKRQKLPELFLNPTECLSRGNLLKGVSTLVQEVFSLLKKSSLFTLRQRSSVFFAVIEWKRPCLHFFWDDLVNVPIALGRRLVTLQRRYYYKARCLVRLSSTTTISAFHGHAGLCNLSFPVRVSGLAVGYS